MIALTRYLGFRSMLPRFFGSRAAASVPEKACTKQLCNKGFSFAGMFSSFIATLRTLAKPLLLFPPIAALFAWDKARGADEIKELDTKLSEKQTTESLATEHKALEKEGLYQFYKAKGEGKKPLVIVNLGTMQDFKDKDAGLMQVVDHVCKNHEAHVLVLKAPHAWEAVKHFTGMSDDASATTEVRTYANTELIKDVVEAKGAFAEIKVSGVCNASFSWGAGMFCQMRKQGLFERLRIPILGTATIDGIKPGIENLGEGLDELCAGDEPNIHFYQGEPSYGLNGTKPRDCCINDKVYCVEGSSHEELDNDPWVISKVCQFMDRVIASEAKQSSLVAKSVN